MKGDERTNQGYPWTLKKVEKAEPEISDVVKETHTLSIIPIYN